MIDLPEMPQRIARPSDWVRAITVLAHAAITSYEADSNGVGPFAVEKVKYRIGGGAGPDERCGTLAIDGSTWFPTTDPWPRPRDPAGPAAPCGTATSLNVIVRYVSCVSGPTDGGSAPPEAKEARQQLDLMDLAWHVFERFLLAEQARRPSLPGSGVLAALGTTRVGTASRLPVDGGGSGFSMPVQCKIGQGC